MQDSFLVDKVLNNNVLIALHPSYGEVVLIGKGIGFGKKKDNPVTVETVEKMFILKNEKEQEQYKKLLPYLDEEFIELMNDVIFHIKNQAGVPLGEHIHVALTDHMAFAIKRIQQGLDLKNPFILETRAMYPEEYRIAREVVAMIDERMGILLPEGEIGFIALHIHSAITDKNISEINQHSELINLLIRLIEDHLQVTINRETVSYMRLVRHFQFTIERSFKGEQVVEPKKLSEVLKEEYPICYNLAWKLIKVIQQKINQPVCDAEAIYLTMHLQRFTNKYA